MANTMICPECGRKFKPKGRQKYCSRKCQEKSWRAKQPMVDVGELATELMSKMTQAKRLVRIPSRKRWMEGPVEESAVLMLSDIHVGQINEFVDYETGEKVETYNYEVMVAQANNLVESICRINDLLSSNYEINKLYILGLGDWIDGDVIYRGQRLLVSEGVGRQTLIAVQLITDMILELFNVFDEIDLTVIPGNHGRMGTNPRSFISEPSYNNFEFLLGKMMQMAFKNEPRINIVAPDSTFFMRNIHGWKYYLHHGATVRSWMGLPYYGIVRQSKNRRTEIPFDVECMGHFHTSMEIPVSGRAFSVVNGAWCPKSEYAWSKLGIMSYPQQRYFGVSQKRPRTWAFSLDLGEWNKNVPEKYI